MSAVNFKRDCKFTTLFLFCKFFLDILYKILLKTPKKASKRPIGMTSKKILPENDIHAADTERHSKQLCLIAKHCSPDLTTLTTAHEAKLFGRRGLD